MKFPFCLQEIYTMDKEADYSFLHSSIKERFGGSRSIRETVWRRHQEEANRKTSGWQSPNDARRRLLHVRDNFKEDIEGDRRFGMTKSSFVLHESYIYLNVKNEAAEIEKYLARIFQAVKNWSLIEVKGNKLTFKLYDLITEISLNSQNPYDRFYDIPTPAGYEDLEVVIRSSNFIPDPVIKHRPWHVLKTSGIRKINPRGEPTYLNPEELAEFLPAHIELGCGPSIEAGIPPLKHLHSVYGITNREGGFNFNAEDDRLLEIFEDPIAKYREITEIHLKTLHAEVPSFYKSLVNLRNKGLIFEPVMTNNFDGLAISAGLEEHFLRGYDLMATFPAISFDSRAKSLIVVGSHADRRTCQQQARKVGLPVIYVNPEGYFENGGFTEYLLESPQNDDFVIQMEAGSAFKQLEEYLEYGNHSNNSSRGSMAQEI